jgi:peroxiredoxin
MVVRVGQKAPDFDLPDTENKLRSLGEFLQKGPLTIAFFAFAFSGVCDKEMCTLRDRFSTIEGPSIQVVGISVDSVYALRAFAQTYNLHFPLLSDFNKKVTKTYGVLQDPWVAHGYRGVAKRSVFLIDSRGILRYKWITDLPSEEPPYGDIARAVKKVSN